MNKKIFLSALLISFAVLSNAQVIESKKTGDEEPNIFTRVEIEANTNPKAWTEHVKKSTQLPDSALENIPSGTYKINCSVHCR